MSSITENRNWRLSGFLATLVITLSIPLAVIFHEDIDIKLVSVESAEFVGKETCVDCHKKEYDLWVGSHHDKAMELATDQSVLGDFNNAEFVSNGKVHKFYKRDSSFFVFTEGPEGKMEEFSITHTFGYTPLQQYLVPFPDGKYQCLPIAWDTENKRWFDMARMLYTEEELKPDSWLFWTNQGQNWNGMCAECHSTNLKKNYDPVKKTYNTTWSEIDVSCEACHGPGSAHLEWAKLPEMGRDYDGDLGLLFKHSSMTSIQQVDLCAPCHSRRGGLGQYDFHQPELLNNAEPHILTEPTYFIDGQILDEDYVYGSFTQSKMYLNDVQCRDCHDVHSGKRLFEGNELCLQCHRKNEYDTYDHHFHKKKGEKGEPLKLSDGKVSEVGEGALCEKCHMPGRYYMGIDYRPDHSMRIPRPDLTIKINTPNACNDCHSDNDARWSDSYIKKWYGEKRKSHYGELFFSAARREPSALPELISMITDELYSEMHRATAVYYLAVYNDSSALAAMKNALNSTEPLIRFTAARYYNSPDIRDFTTMLFPLLSDPVKAVRINAVSKLVGIPDEGMNEKQKKLIREVAKEYEKSLLYMADFATSRHNLGNFYYNFNDKAMAEENYLESIRIDNQFFPAKVNLALLYYNNGELDKAAELYLDMIDNNPEYTDAHFNLGLLYAEQKRFDLAVKYLEAAAGKAENSLRIFYNLGLIYQYVNDPGNAEAALLRAFAIAPKDLRTLHALADIYVRSGKFSSAKKFANLLHESHPENPVGQQILDFIENQSIN